MDNIASTMFLDKNINGSGIRFETFSVPMVTNNLEKQLWVIIRGTYQESGGDSRWDYDQV